MQFSVKTGKPVTLKTDCAIVPLYDGASLTGAAKDFDKSSGGLIRRLIRSGDASGKLGKTLLLRDLRSTQSANLLLVGCGTRSGFGHKQLGIAAAAAAAALADTSLKNSLSFLGYDRGRGIETYLMTRTTVQAMRAALYRFNEQKSQQDPAPKLSRVGIVVGADDDAAEARSGIKDGSAIANGMDLARDLGNRSPNVCTPSHLANVAREIAKLHPKMSVKVLAEKDMEKLGMGALLAVTRGAKEPARFIVLEYKGAPAAEAPIALCGKGITFDTGGISLKPPPKMDEMKFDMCGGASVLGTMRTVAELAPACNVVGIVPTCENMPGGEATRPGDIVTSLSGQTIEILNTDAEGRLILCDALTYAQQFEPRCIIDVATLTGACVIALGPVYAGLFTTDEDLRGDLVAAGRRASDEAWPMPADEEYGESLRSNFADFANVGSRDGGASVAAQFLSRFVKGVPWAHLDIAGVAWRQNQAKGATGRPVAMLVDYLLGQQAK